MSDEKRASAPDGKISVMVVDDDYLVRRAVPMLMAEDDIELIGVCETRQDAVELAARAHPQVALVDMRLQGDDRAGVELIRELRAISPDTVCCVITGADVQGDLFADAFYAGAQGYSRKGDSRNGDLCDLTRRLAKGEWVVDSEIAARYVRRATGGGQWQAPRPGGSEPRLTDRELECLALVAQQLSTAEIGRRMFITSNTVKTHVAHIISKLQVQNRDQAVLYAVLNGLFTSPDDASD
ncbi:MAG TPA: response regulator transcription factor [Ktedonobacterales bacterium]|nr:response regulator transcription factor [Ktedonobacterales bacterium]